MHIVLGHAKNELVQAITLSPEGVELSRDSLSPHDLAGFVSTREAQHPRWVWSDTSEWYPKLLQAGVRVERCYDVRLCHAILRSSQFARGSVLQQQPRSTWDEPAQPASRHDGLFALGADVITGDLDVLAEWRRQRDAVEASIQSSRLRLLLAAESAGALTAAEIAHCGLPWRADVHERMLRDVLGPRPRSGERPAKLEALAAAVREALDAPTLNPDSPHELVRALTAVGLTVTNTRSWELMKLDHPAIAPLLDYKKRARLLSANGWSWLDSWVSGGRFRPDYVVGGVVSGRWATRGGGALQLPKAVRAAVVADPGWMLVVADAGQLEPRILAALARDEKMTRAGSSGDLYDGLVASAVMPSRRDAKLAMLGAMYGATTGDSARLMPRLVRSFPDALNFVEQAARTGEQGGVVSSLLGRSSPLPDERFSAAQRAARLPDATPADERRAQSLAREWGRFTRNFVVQATAAEWALCWLAELRNILFALSKGDISERPHLVYFLHDEIIVHTPAHLAEQVAAAVSASAARAGEILFPGFPAKFPVGAVVTERYSDAP